MLAAWACVSAAALSGVAAAQEPAPAPLAQVDRELGEIEKLLDAAYFRTALSVAAATRQLLAEAGSAPGVAARHARLEVLTATGELALGRRARARGSLERALQADAALSLDEAQVSPRLIELLEEVRRGLHVAGAPR